MSTRILFVQGAGERVHDDWDRKLVESLEHALGREADVIYPQLPDEADPRYSPWKDALLDEFERLGDGAILIGHSIGGAFLIHVLAEASLKWKPRALVLIAAPFIGAGGWRNDEIRPHADLAERLPGATRIFLFHGTDDSIVPLSHAKLYAEALPQAILRVVPGRDHQFNDNLDEIAAAIRSLLSAQTGARDACN